MTKKPYTVLLLLLITLTSAAQIRTRLVSTLTYSFFDIDAVDIRVDSGVYVYSNGRGGVPGQTINSDTCIGYGSGGYFSYLFAQQFDVNDRVTYNHRANYFSSYWQGIVGERYTYNTTGQVLTDTTLQYSFVPIHRNEESYTWLKINSYNTSGTLVTTHTLKATSNPLHQWDTTKREIYHYSSTGLLLAKQTDTLLSTGFSTNDSSLYSYNTSGLCTLSLSKKLINSNWVNQNGHAYTYNTHGDIAAQYDIDFTHSIADTTDITFTFYNTAYLPQGVVHSKRYYNTLLTLDSTGTIYNTNNLPDTFVQYFWSNNMWSHEVNKAMSAKYIYETYTPSGITGVAGNEAQLSLYPIPAANMLYLQLKEKEQQQYTVSVTDMQGRQVFFQIYMGNTTQAINTSQFPAGVYTIILYSGKGSVQHSKFTVVR